MKRVTAEYRQITTLDNKLELITDSPYVEFKILDASPVGNETLWAVLTLTTETD